MKKLSEGKRMWACVMGIFLVYAVTFILFEDYDKHFLQPFDEVSDWHLLLSKFNLSASILNNWVRGV